MKIGAVLVIASLIVGSSPMAADLPLAERRSGYDLMSPELRLMQDDDSANPGMLSVLDGEALWNRGEGETNKSCADCHGAVAGMSSLTVSGHDHCGPQLPC